MHARSAGIVVVTLALVAGAVTPAMGATRQETVERGIEVQLREDGSARVTLTVTFDLENANQSDAFQQLQSDASTRERFRRAFLRGMQAVARSAENETGREMRVHNASLELRTVGNTGVVEQSVTWEGLAAVDGDTLTVTEPFASGFEPERQFQLVVPDGYTVASATPSPDARTDGVLTWDAGTSLDGFEVVLESTATATTTSGDGTTAGGTTTGQPSTGTTAGSGPGFGVGATLSALLAAGVLATRFRGDG